MSRCFPFPPPGYERKHRPEDLDLLKEVKSKEKKPKKEKKDKERKKDKEKEKDGSAEKHRDKRDRKEKHKDKKEKHRDKKKDKKEDRGKDKEKSSISEESTVSRNTEISEPKLYSIVNSEDRVDFPNEVKCSALLEDQKNGGKPSQNEESKFVQELDRRIKDEQIRGSQLPERVAVADKKDQNMPAVRNSSGAQAEEKCGNKNNNRFDKSMVPQGLKNEFSGNTVAQNVMPAVKGKGEGMPRPTSEENGRRLEDKEKYKETVVGVKRVDKEKEKSRGKDKDREKEEKRKKKKDEKAKLKSESKKIERDKSKDDGRRNNNVAGFAGNKSTDILKVDDGNAVNEGNIKKRKDMVSNGFLHENEMRPNKIQKPPPHQSTENGRKLDPFPTPPKPSNDKHSVPNTFRVDSEDQSMINGIFEAPKPSLSIPNPPAAIMVTEHIPEPSKLLPQRDSNDLKKAAVSKMEDPIFAESSRRSPHPDSKYLAEVLAVPEKMSDWFDNDEQDWLFCEKVQSTAKLGPVGDDVRVWSEAVHIESADICALPYVIPY